MLFPGHERSRRLLGHFANSCDTPGAQEQSDLDKHGRGPQPLNLDSSPDNKQIQELVTSPITKQKQSSEVAPAQTIAKLENEWPNGKPPTGPRKHLQHTSHFPSRRQTSVSEIGEKLAADTSSSAWIVQGLSPSMSHHTSTNSLATTKLSGRLASGTHPTLESSVGAKFCIRQSGRKISPVEARMNVTTPASTTEKESRNQSNRTPDMHRQGNLELSEYSPPDSISMLRPTSTSQKSPSLHHSHFIAAGTNLRHNIGIAMNNPKWSANKTDTLHASSPLGVRHRDIAYVIKQYHRSCSETASVTSGASSVAEKSSSSSISSTLQLSICHICKKPPFREKLKGCFECSRHYHKGCANPKDRITEDGWVCRRCLKKYAKKLEQSLPSSSQLPFIEQPKGVKEHCEAPKIACTVGSTDTGSFCEVTSNQNPQLESALCSGVKDHNRPMHARNDPSSRTLPNDLLAPKDVSPTATVNLVAPLDLNAILATEAAKDTNTGAAQTSFNDSTPDIPSYFNGWQAKVQGHAMKTNPLAIPKNLAPSSSAVAPSAVDSHTFFATGTLPASRSSSYADLVTASEDTKLFWKDNPVPEMSSGVSEGGSFTSEREVQRAKDPFSSTEMHLPKSPCLSWAAGQTSDTSKANQQGTHTTQTTTTTANRVNARNSVPPVKKLCSQCQRLILGSTSMCTKCRQAKGDKVSYHSKEKHDSEHREPAEISKMNMTVLHETACSHCASNECQCANKGPRQNFIRQDLTCNDRLTEVSPTSKSYSQDGMGSFIPKHDQTAVPGSPVVPETPGMVSERANKSLPIVHVEKPKIAASPQKSPKPSVPQKRPAIRSGVADNERCFSKKKARIFRPTISSIATNVPAIDLNKFPPTPKSVSPLIEHNVRDASVQTSVSTVHRGTSPSSTHYEHADRFEVCAKGSATLGVPPEQATSPRSNISGVNGVQYQPPLFSPHSNQKSEQRRMKERGRTILEQQAHRGQDHEQARAAIARHSSAVEEGDQSPTQKSSTPLKEACKPEHDEEIVTYPRVDSLDHANDSASHWTLSDEKVLLNTLQRRGVIFEQDTSCESDADMPPPRARSIPKDPFWRRPQSSKDLFLIAPALDVNHSPFDVERKRKEIAARPSRKQRRLNISYLRQERGTNVHEEIERTFPARMVKVSSILTSESGETIEADADRNTAEPRPEAEMTFGDFIGAPAKPMAILTKDKELAFRDGTRDGKGDLPRAREKFIVTNKSVACMEV